MTYQIGDKVRYVPSPPDFHLMFKKGIIRSDQATRLTIHYALGEMNATAIVRGIIENPSPRLPSLLELEILDNPRLARPDQAFFASSSQVKSMEDAHGN
jgi:hypothetical protein